MNSHLSLVNFKVAGYNIASNLEVDQGKLRAKQQSNGIENNQPGKAGDAATEVGRAIETPRWPIEASI